MTVTGPLALQVDLFLDAVPGLLGPALFVTGMLLLTTATLWEFTTTGGITDHPVVATTGYVVLMVGGLAGLYVTYQWLFVVVVVFVGRWIEGVAAVRLLRRVVEYLRGGGGVGATTGRLVYYLLAGFVVLAGLLAALGVALFGPLFGSRSADLRLVWTFVALGLSLVSFSRKVRPLNVVAPAPMLAGLVLLVSSTEIYNLQLGADLLAYAFGSLGYVGGYWGAVYRLRSGY